MTSPEPLDGPIRSGDMDSLREAISDGRYHVDALAVADAFLRHVHMADISERFERDSGNADQSIEGSGTPVSRD